MTDEHDDEQEENRELWRLDDSQLEGQHQDRYLQTDLTDNELARRLFAISRKAQEVMEEQGYSVLYLALDYLEWKQREDEERTYIAPLILIPIELQRPIACTSRWR